MATDIRERTTQDSHAEETRTGHWYRPPVDILERGDELLIVADVPGATAESVDIDFEDGLLTIAGKVAPRYAEDTRFLVSEYGVGNFHRTFRVSEKIDSRGIHAEYAAGVLTVHLPKVAAPQSRKIQVQST